MINPERGAGTSATGEDDGTLSGESDGASLGDHDGVLAGELGVEKWLPVKVEEGNFWRKVSGITPMRLLLARVNLLSEATLSNSDKVPENELSER